MNSNKEVKLLKIPKKRLGNGIKRIKENLSVPKWPERLWLQKKNIGKHSFVTKNN